MAGKRAPIYTHDSSAEEDDFDPEGDGYDKKGAKAAGLEPDDTGHWPTRDPKTGVIFKGRKHPTIEKSIAADKELGYTMRKRPDGRYESQKDE